jgi:hypothetical protein
MRLHRILFAFNALVLLVLVYFFIEGLQYGSGGDAVVIWLPILGVPIAVMAGAWALRANGKQKLASLLLFLLALPALLYILFFGLLILINPSWQ